MTPEEIQQAGGSAFPPAGYSSGMTLRDYFAAAALPVVMKNWADSDNPGQDSWSDHPLEMAEVAYDIADAMLEARKPKG